jgi:hypothetical protein
MVRRAILEIPFVDGDEEEKQALLSGLDAIAGVSAARAAARSIFCRESAWPWSMGPAMSRWPSRCPTSSSPTASSTGASMTPPGSCGELGRPCSACRWRTASPAACPTRRGSGAPGPCASCYRRNAAEKLNLIQRTRFRLGGEPVAAVIEIDIRAMFDLGRDGDQGREHLGERKSKLLDS